jgi:hypothetical protein
MKKKKSTQVFKNCCRQILYLFCIHVDSKLESLGVGIPSSLMCGQYLVRPIKFYTLHSSAKKKGCLAASPKNFSIVQSYYSTIY